MGSHGQSHNHQAVSWVIARPISYAMGCAMIFQTSHRQVSPWAVPWDAHVPWDVLWYSAWDVSWDDKHPIGCIMGRLMGFVSPMSKTMPCAIEYQNVQWTV